MKSLSPKHFKNSQQSGTVSSKGNLKRKPNTQVTFFLRVCTLIGSLYAASSV